MLRKIVIEILKFPCPTWKLSLRLCAIVVASLLPTPPRQELGAADPVSEPILVTINQLELPSSRQAQAILHGDARFAWDQTPLRTGLQELTKIYGISIWIDRQIDPSQPITTLESAQAGSSLQSRLRQIAKVAGAEVGLIENVIYVGPPNRVSALQRAAIELHDQISRSGDRTAQLRPWHWDELVSSTELLEQLAKQWNIQISGTLPHDLYHAGQLAQPTTLATQLSLLLGGFGLQAERKPTGQFEIRELRPQSRWQATYRKEDLGLRGLARWKAEYPGSECLTRGAVSQVQGVTNFHLALLAPQAASPAAKSANASARWGFEVRNTPVEAVLAKLAPSLALEIHWDEACTAAMRAQLISFKVDQASTDQLLAEISRVSGLKLERDDRTVRVRP